ncbi:hypothetical protein D9615_002847 [Tricholomella constricta]|uniref:Reverse transcriptase domain-containing protein n=1 Tax=Tricholomella constricta TaxID=117010 RepID=A0A8H5HG51_9AGAR|nr:hypothetical protein D9615_002847 [Tricholomella constricta]
MPFVPGPLRPPPVSDERADSPPPTFDPSSRPFTGLELTVSGLDRSGPQSAVDHLKKIVGDLTDRGQDLPDLEITPGSYRTAQDKLDYATVSLTGPLKTSPRPDILEFVRKILDDTDDITALWRIQHGPDKSRQLAFVSQNKQDASALKDKLDNVFRHQHLDVQATTIARNGSRITYTFVNRKSVETLLTNRPVVETQPGGGTTTITPVVPRFVQPVYGLEVAITNVGGYPQAQVIIDSYIRTRYGVDAWRSSRLEQDGTVYTVVLRDPDVTTSFLTDPFEAFPDVNEAFKPNKPDYLYNLNTASLPTIRSNTRANEESPFVRQQLDGLNLQVQTLAQTLNKINIEHHDLIEAMRAAQDRYTNMFTNTVVFQMKLSQQLLAQGELSSLRNSLSTAQLLLTLATTDAQRDNVSTHIADLGQRLLEEQRNVADLRRSADTFLNSLLPSTMSATNILTLPAQPPLTPPGLPIPPTASPVTPLPPGLPAEQGTPVASSSKKRPRQDTGGGSAVHQTPRPPSHEGSLLNIDNMEVDPSSGSTLPSQVSSPFSQKLMFSNFINREVKSGSSGDRQQPSHWWGPTPGIRTRPSPPRSIRFLPQNYLHSLFFLCLPIFIFRLFCLRLKTRLGLDTFPTLPSLYSIALPFSPPRFGVPFVPTGLRPNHTKISPLSRARRPRFIYLFLMSSLLFSLFLSSAYVSASSIPMGSGSSVFRIIALNANGLADPMKVAAISDMIRSLKPNAFVIGETKSPHKVAHRLNMRDYSTHESPGRPAGHRNRGKWGVIVAVHRSISCGSPLPLPASLDGRALALDLIIPTANNQAFTHRLIGVYAPWDPGTAPHQFWPEIRDLCNSTPHSWSLHGDFNATVASSESSHPTLRLSNSRVAYTAFLRATSALDLWAQIPDRSLHDSFTFKGHNSDPDSPDVNAPRVRSIIDRTALSVVGTVSGSITTLSNFIPSTDHVPTLSSVVLAPPSNAQGDPSVPTELPPSTYAPRFRYPHRSQSHQLKNFTAAVDHRLDSSDLQRSPVSDDPSFDRVYQQLTDILMQAARESFDLPRPAAFKTSKPMNPTIRVILRELHRVNRLISALNTLLATGIDRYPSTPWAPRYYAAFLASSQQNYSTGTYRSYLTLLRRHLNRIRYAEERECRRDSLVKQSSSKISAVLNGGSAKQLFPHHFSQLPLALAPNPLSDPDVIFTGPENVKTITQQYFSNLYHRTPRPPQDKPWIRTPSVRGVTDRVLTDPFNWPQLLDLSTLRSLLGRGNARPTPGPDGWEKWFVKLLSDRALNIVLALANYTISTSSFPSSVKGTNISTIHKRGPPLFLSNYRGIACSNFLLNLPFAWLNTLLGPYVAKHGIIPNCQVATQPGVQGRDLISFVAQIQKYAKRTQTPLYILQRDQRKGFDMLQPEGFYDAISAYGLPRSIIDLDRSSQHQVLYRVKTAYGFTEPFVVDGVTKQGGSLSPLKCTLTTSLGNRWLSDLQHDQPGEIHIKTINHARHGVPHLPSEASDLRISMIEAMDDSLLLYSSIPLLMSMARHADRFQATYGWETEWRKSVFYAYNSPFYPNSSPDPTISIPSVDFANPSSPTTLLHEVRVVTSHTVFLRVPIDQPDVHFQHIHDLISDFNFPLLNRRLPLTALRRLISQCLISKIRPLIAFQPLPPDLATKLDHLIAQKVHEYLGFPFRFNSLFLFTPLSLRGFDFPSVVLLNSALATAGIQRDLNHHLLPFRQMARVTLSDWACQFNGCVSPLAVKHPLRHPSPHFISKHLPVAWVVARAALADLDLSVLPTDLSHVLDGSIHILHLYNLCRAQSSFNLPQDFIPIRTFANFARYGFTLLRHFGQWTYHPSLLLPVAFQPLPNFTHSNPCLRRDWPLFTTWLQLLFHFLPDLSYPDPLLLLPRPARQALSENLLIQHLSHAPPLFQHHAPDNLYASDASMISVPFTPRYSSSSVTFAVVANGSVLTLSLSNFRNSASILAGEAYGVAAAYVLALHRHSHPSQDQTVILYSDHLASVKTVTSARLSPPHSLARKPSRSLYRWILDLNFRSLQLGLTIDLQHVKAHTTSSSTPAQLNRLADHAATSAQKSLIPIPPAPLTTFCMDDFSIFSATDGWVETDLSRYVQRSLAFSFFSHNPLLNHYSSLLYDHRAPPNFPYTRSTSSFSAVVQLYLRAHQLDTQSRLTARLRSSEQPYCRFGCQTLEDARHIFVRCPRFSTLREDANKTIVSATSTLFDVYGVPAQYQSCTLEHACNISHDSQSWPTGFTMYYYGVLPDIDGITRDLTRASLPSLKVERLRLRLAATWHTILIRLAGRIWGIAKRASPSSPPSSPDNHSRKPLITLPRHLSHIPLIVKSQKFSIITTDT